jgi:predicted phage baseplate assembly protein
VTPPGASRPWSGVGAPAKFDLTPDPRKAVAALELFELLPPETGVSADDQAKWVGAALAGRLSETDEAAQLERYRAARWESRPDLLDSGPADRHFVVETDDDGRPSVRFGDGRSGRRPRPGARFVVRYRFGNGTAGLVGTEAITEVVGTGLEHIRRVRNPVPAAGGVDPEPTATAKLLAPTAFRSVLHRAITPDDYARLAERDDRVQRAAAVFRWTPTGTEVRVAVDLLAAATAGLPDAAAEVRRVCAEVEDYLSRFRRVGHDVRVVPAALVPLLVKVAVRRERHAEAGKVRAAVRAALAPGVGAGGRRGFFDPDELTFGQRIDAGAVVACVMAVPDVAGVELKRLCRRSEPGDDAAATGFLAFGPLEVPRLDADPVFPEFGELIVEVEAER